MMLQSRHPKLGLFFISSIPMILTATMTVFAIPARAIAQADIEKAAEGEIISVSLFKNGLAVIQRQVPLQGPGLYRIEDVPEPVHGTFYVESNGPIEARVESRKVPSKNQVPIGTNLQDELAGLKVTITGRSANSPIVGTVLTVPKPDTDPSQLTSSATYPLVPYSRLPSGSAAPVPASAPSRFLILKTDRGISYVDLSEIVALEAEGKPQQKEPSLEVKAILLLVAKSKEIGNLALVSYLAHGLSWAPSYRVNMLNGKELLIEQNAAIRNELADLNGTDVFVISGYPSVQFGEVVSPIAATQNWSTFFQQLRTRGSTNAMNNSFVTQNVAYNMAGNNGERSGPSMAPNLGDTIDLHYHSIGKRSIKRGDAITVTTGAAKVDYERIVEWTIPDNRDEWGKPTNNRRVDPSNGEPLQDDVWDALKFKNALPFPMTSAPAMVTTEGRFSGQSQLLWTNQGEVATLRVNKALSIRAEHVEYENQTDRGQAERDLVYIDGRRFRKVTVNCELRLCNHRQSVVKLIVKRQFSGEYVKGDDQPKIDLRLEGVWTVNKRNELTWTLKLKPAEERTVKFQYTSLIHF
ncbi:MAG: hypothetical protein U0930_07930 [Pirellulales bacterium]